MFTDGGCFPPWHPNRCISLWHFRQHCSIIICSRSFPIISLLFLKYAFPQSFWERCSLQAAAQLFRRKSAHFPENELNRHCQSCGHSPVFVPSSHHQTFKVSIFYLVLCSLIFCYLWYCSIVPLHDFCSLFPAFMYCVNCIA